MASAVCRDGYGCMTLYIATLRAAMSDRASSTRRRTLKTVGLRVALRNAQAEACDIALRGAGRLVERLHSTPRMRSTSEICAGVLLVMRASDLVTKRGVSAAIAARRPIRSVPD